MLQNLISNNSRASVRDTYFWFTWESGTKKRYQPSRGIEIKSKVLALKEYFRWFYFK
nr:1994_t:CDS:1 [Entrophospora candida]